ncbi:3'-5' exonuclease KapD [Bacillus sp. AGMB 02131]|uniref:3'-5' exonuclease KapD n=1 Tax=Peribacillus faecalis TaxID=2772559 RepID=A0A927CWF7_9BACI|nr:3'-5' exonuclease KapD [Peribacillus faecalis]MBD3109022.1 3'-5' exonuclease KapD [Peribacillus faecalis]
MEKDHQYIFIDFEFTMPEGKVKNGKFFPEIIEVGSIVVVNDQIIDEYSAFIRPEKFPILSERCKNFLGIEQSSVDSGVSFKYLVDKLSSYRTHLPTSVITWGNMDMKVLKQNCQAHNLDFPFNAELVDFAMEYKRFFGDQNQTGLWKAVKEYGKDGVGKHHRALDDAMTTYNIYKLVAKDKKYMEKHEPTTIGDLIDLSKVFNKLA